MADRASRVDEADSSMADCCASCEAAVSVMSVVSCPAVKIIWAWIWSAERRLSPRADRLSAALIISVYARELSRANISIPTKFLGQSRKCVTNRLLMPGCTCCSATDWPNAAGLRRNVPKK